MSNVVELDRFRPRRERNEGTTFVSCLTCRTHVELGVDVCPSCGADPTAAPLVAPPVPMPVVLEAIDEHLYAPADPFCSECGVHIAEATRKPCGPR